MTKALFFDIDGTLVSFKTHKIPQETIEAIEKAKENGCGIFISTGRPHVIIDNLGALTDKKLIDGFITMNGGYCFVGDKVIYKSALHKEDAKKMLEYCKEKGISSVVVGEDKIAICQVGELVKKIFYGHLRIAEPLPEVTEDEALAWDDIYQLTPFITEEQEKDVELPNSELSRWHPAFTDITAKGNTKHRGIDEIIKYFDIPLEDTISFGDGGNDVSMLKHAHIGVAMDNAAEDVKKYADFITKSVDDGGIAYALKHFGLIT